MSAKREEGLERRGFQFGRNLRSPLEEGKRPDRNPLEDYFDSHTDGRGIWKWRHYFEIYHRHFEKFRGRPVHIVEIGVLSGGSLQMWKHYFGPRCRIYGVDIEPACEAYADAQTRIFVGDQGDSGFWDKFIAQVPTIDVVIDDGGHEPEQQIVALEALLPHVRAGGIYLCEDVHGARNPFHSYVNGLARNLHGWTSGEEGFKRSPNHFQRAVQAVHIYPWVVVIEKRISPLTELSAPKRGREWQVPR